MKKTVELSAEELKMIEAMRSKKIADEEAAAAKKIAQEKAALAEKARQEAHEKMLEKFEKALETTRIEINKHIENAREELNKAIALSEETGIPFRSNLTEVEGERRLYMPSSLSKKWPGLDSGDLAELDLYDYNGDGESGWEYWNTSSLSC